MVNLEFLKAIVRDHKSMAFFFDLRVSRVFSIGGDAGLFAR
jgi:hypothetical protein